MSYKFSNYQEDDLSRSEVPFGDLDRYDIDVHQFQLLTPVGRNWALQLDANHEEMSGASPWFTTPDAQGRPIVSLSGASGITDSRSELSITGHYFLENGKLAGNIGYSEENDYRAVYFGFSGERHFNNDMTTVAVGVSHSDDEVFPTDALLFGRVLKEDKSNSSLFVSVSQIINQSSTWQGSVSISEMSGFLSDPYKFRDVRPGDKTQLTLANSYRHYFSSADAALHLNHRYYHDDFGISSHTVDASWHQNINRDFRVVPTLRYYSQSAADFHTNIDDFSRPLNEYQSSDYRLSAFGAFSAGLHLIGKFGNWEATLSAERYLANEKYSAHTVNEPAAALIQYNRVSFGLDYKY
ncbi:MAG: hypothetical protein DHS20C12_29420 [Pseudohongiella sp.]|nr:MAG: hypothetical protein DHS20C12_29420 [Pseudohongiella sp.]